MSSIDCFANLSPQYVSRNVVSVSDTSAVNFMVGWCPGDGGCLLVR